MLVDVKSDEPKMMDNPKYEPIKTATGKIFKSVGQEIESKIVSPVKNASASFIAPSETLSNATPNADGYTPDKTHNDTSDGGTNKENNSPKSGVDIKTNHNNSFYSKNSNKFNATSIANN